MSERRLSLKEFVHPDLSACIDSREPMKSLSALQGEVFREVAERKTIRFEHRGRNYFAKVHRGVGWREIFKNLALFRLPVTGAGTEYRAILRLRQLGVETMEPVAFVSRGFNPASLASCIVTREIENTVSLEDYLPAAKPGALYRRKLTEALASISRRLHEGGVNHRDFYLCHFLLDIRSLEGDHPLLYLIDLHRAQLRRRTPRRWKVKDIGGLLFSAMDLDLDRKDLFRFMRIYSGDSLRETLTGNRGFWKAVMMRAQKLYLQNHPELPERFQVWKNSL